MIVALWLLTFVLVGLWTLTAGLTAAGIGWLVAQAPLAADWAGQIANLPLPPWLALWMDPTWAEWARQLLVQAIAGLSAWGPWLQPVLGWLVPLTWVIWALGLVVLLVLAGAGHWAARRWKRRHA